MSGNGWPTSRRYARTMAEAFPDSRAEWSEGWCKPKGSRWANRLLTTAIGIALAVAMANWVDVA